jgi:hypothetical protein
MMPCGCVLGVAFCAHVVELVEILTLLSGDLPLNLQ